MRPSDLGSVPTSMRCHVREYASLVYGDMGVYFGCSIEFNWKHADVPFPRSATSQGACYDNISP